jgi:hypothetical protein
VATATEFALTETTLVKNFRGFGVQLNHHVFAPHTMALGVPEASFADLEAKVVRLAPQFVRIFYNDRHAGVPFDKRLPPSPENRHQDKGQERRWASFVRVCKVAQKAGATINVTWQGGPLATPEQRKTSVTRFAKVLEILSKQEHISNLRWVTIANEPNTPPRRRKKKPGETPPPKPPKPTVTPGRLADMYRRLDKQLTDKGLRQQIRFMGGDLIDPVKDPKSPYHEKRWFEHMSTNLHDVLDAYSVHIYWNYWNTGKFKKRLDAVRDIVSKLDHPMPVYVTEFGTRGRERRPSTVNDPGNFHEGSIKVPLARSKVAAFQHALFQILALQHGCVAASKWDCHFGKYDLKEANRQAYYAIGPPAPAQQPRQWQLYPMYFLLRLMTITSAPGWKVLRVKRSPAASATKHLVALKGVGKGLTILGLDERGALRERPSKVKVPYTIGGLPPLASFKLLLWNRAGGGKLVFDRTVTVNAAGTAKITVPLHSVFALTTKPLPPL